MNKGRIISSLAIAAVSFFVLFEVHFGTGDDGQVPDPEIEAAFDACFAGKDDEIHTTAFGTIDNPDVQKEFITSNRARAIAECRELHPERLITIEKESGLFGIKLTPRFW